jgi:BMFP domain-containing protein YqiC
MIDLAAIDDLARRLSNLVPPGMSQARDDLEQNIKATLQMSLRKREKMDALERTVEQLEARLRTQDAE